MLHRIRYWIRAIFRHEALDRDIREEMQLHIDRRTEMLIAGGVRPEEARLTARREFGNPTTHHDASRDALRTRWIDSIRGDVRFALRYFARKPAPNLWIIGTAVAVAVVVVASIATLIPATRAATVNPVIALRAE
jgi:ABC-type antimicrobial peptide transport system permease subunit